MNKLQSIIKAEIPEELEEKLDKGNEMMLMGTDSKGNQVQYEPVSYTHLIVAPGGGDEESRVLYDNGDGTYSDAYGSRYSYQGDGCLLYTSRCV